MYFPIHRYKSNYKPNIDIASGDQDSMAITMKCSFETPMISRICRAIHSRPSRASTEACGKVNFVRNCGKVGELQEQVH